MGRWPDGTIRSIGPVPELRPGIGARPGTPLTLSKKIVCAGCNRGWMSRLETKAQSIFELLVADDTAATSPSQLFDLAAWCCLKAVNHTFAITRGQPGWPHPGTFNEASLSALKSHQVPRGFTVMICSLDGVPHWGGHKLNFSNLGTRDQLGYSFAGQVEPLGFLVAQDEYGRGTIRLAAKNRSDFLRIIADDTAMDVTHRDLRKVPAKILDNLMHEIGGRAPNYRAAFTSS